MANSAEIRSGLGAFVQKKSSTRVRNTLFNVMPFLELLMALHADKGDKDASVGLGRPGAGLLVSGVESAKARKESLMAERVYMPLIQISKPSVSEVKSMNDYDNDPRVQNWETNSPLSRFTQPRFKFSRLKMPYKIPHSEVRTAVSSARTEGEAAKAVRSVYDAEVKTREAVLCEAVNQILHGTVTDTNADFYGGAPSNEDAVTWNCFHSIQNAIHDSNVYGGVDRSLTANAFYRGQRITSATTPNFQNIIDKCHYDLGMAKKGMGIDLILVNGDLFKLAKAEAKANGYTVVTSGIPEFAEFGFKREIVKIFIGNRIVYIMYEPEMPAGHLAALNLGTWTFAIHKDSNFKVSTPSDQTKNEGGDEADTGTIAAEIMLCCEVPGMNAYFTNVG